MSKTVIINGVTYPDAPYINVPLATGTGEAKFVDSDSGNVSPSDIRNNKRAWSQGEEVVGSQPERTTSDVTVAGKTVTVPAGIYDSPVSKSVADGSVTPDASVSGSVVGSTTSDYPVTITPSATVQAGYVSGNQTGSTITKYVQVEEKTVTPSTSAQDITPTSGKLMDSVHVNPVDLGATAGPEHVLNGFTFFSNTLERKTGTATVPTVTQDSSTKALTIS